MRRRLQRYSSRLQTHVSEAATPRAQRLQPHMHMRRRVVAVVDLEDDGDDVKHEEAPPPPPAAAGDMHGTPQLITAKAIDAQLAGEVSAKLSSEPFLRELVHPNPNPKP